MKMQWILVLSIFLFIDIEASMEARLVYYDRNGARTEYKGATCDQGLLFEDQVEISCICITGVWALYGEWCTQPDLIIAGTNNCFLLSRGKTSQISLLSSSSNLFASTLVRMTPGLEQLKEKVHQDSVVSWEMRRTNFVVIGEDPWELTTVDGKSYCLQTHDYLDSHCKFDLLHLPEELRSSNVTKVKRGCSGKDAVNIMPFECLRFYNGVFGDEEICVEIKPEQHESYTPPTDPASYAETNNKVPTASDELDEDEEWLNPAQSSVINHPDIMQEMKTYVDARVDSSTGFTTSFVANTRGIPAFTLLQKAMLIMQKTCNATVRPAFLEFSLNVFLALQLKRFHLKEPYLSEAEFTRIQTALNKCLQNAQPSYRHFMGNETFGLTTEKDGGLGYEPIVETIWKVFQNARSYCYGHFPNPNDHHAFSKAIASLFTNKIRNIWFNTSTPDGTYVEPAEGLLLYGGSIGSHRSLLNSIDQCVAWSRIQTPSPRLLDRPPFDPSNKRARRRTFYTGPRCLKTAEITASIYTGLGYGRCD